MRRVLALLWQLAAWSTVVAGPVAALGFIQLCVPSVCCQPKRACLLESIEDATGMFSVSIASLFVATAVLWLSRRLASRSAAHSTALLKASVFCALLCTLVVFVLATGMRAVVDGRTDVTAHLLAAALLAIPTSVQLWRSLNATGT